MTSRVAAAAAQGPGDRLEGAVVLLVVLEVADGAVVEVEDDLELIGEGEIAQVGLDELGIDLLELGFGDGV